MGEKLKGGQNPLTGKSDSPGEKWSGVNCVYFNFNFSYTFTLFCHLKWLIHQGTHRFSLVQVLSLVRKLKSECT